MRGWGLAMTVLAAVSAGPVAAAGLELEAKIPLGTVSGRIDQLAIDPVRGRLFVAELGNDSVSVVDLAERRVVKRLAGLDEPQGLALVGDTLYVANAGDGSVRLYQGDDFAPVGAWRSATMPTTSASIRRRHASMSVMAAVRLRSSTRCNGARSPRFASPRIRSPSSSMLRVAAPS
jgi:hypothetical protein